MKLLIAGGTGFIGRHLIHTLLDEGADITIVGRDVKKIQNYFSARVNSVNWNELTNLDPNNFDAIINLAGENIGNKRWSARVKLIIKESRIHATESIIQWCKQITKPLTLYNASAIGIYGLKPPSNSNQAFTEETDIDWGHPTDFLSEVGQTWEQAARNNHNPLLHIVFLRFAPVLHRSEGVLKKMLPLFKLGLGGPIGNGKQAFSWIHLYDAVRAIQFLLNNPNILGPFNICSPNWVTQRQFAKTLGQALHRPAIMPTPAWILKLMFGQMADELLLSGQAVLPQRLTQHQFAFLYPTLEKALAAEGHSLTSS
jgi:uncharacterized protein (TIGR01777 family)